MFSMMMIFNVKGAMKDILFWTALRNTSLMYVPILDGENPMAYRYIVNNMNGCNYMYFPW